VLPCMRTQRLELIIPSTIRSFTIGGSQG
jgi:hypothetical protein